MKKIVFGRNPRETFQSFLCGIPARDYINQKTSYEEQINNAAQMIENADYVLIGAGAGLSTAAGLTMGGERWDNNFSEFEEKYDSPYMKDMYSAGFYPFPSEEAKWGYWSKACMINRVSLGALPLYKNVLKMVQKKKYFVLTTNVDHQFHLAGFREKDVFATQGDFGLIQCRKGCHNKTYDATKMFQQMDQARKDCDVPSYMVPKCPVCGGPMEMNLRADQYFVEDEDWKQAEKRFGEFLSECVDKKTVLLELGCGFNTPTIIRFPFEKLMREHDNLTMIRMNLDEAVVPENLGNRIIGINADMDKSITDLIETLQNNSQANAGSQEEKRIWLIEQLQAEDSQTKQYEIPSDQDEQRNLLRALMNVRVPKKIDEKFLSVQDDYLEEEMKLNGIQDVTELKPSNKSEQIILWQGDITTLKIDAIVNAANSQLCGCFRPLHNCVDNIIHSKSGIQLRLKCNEIMTAQGYEEPTGKAKITPAYNLPCNYVIHTVGPIVQGPLNEKYEKQLASCYESCLRIADEHGLNSIAFCCISTGVFMFPNERAAEIALETVLDYLDRTNSKLTVVFNVFKDDDLEIYKSLLS